MKGINPSRNGQKMVSSLSSLCTGIFAAMGLKDLLDICGKQKFLLKSRYGSGQFGIMPLLRRITCLEEVGVVTPNASFVMKMRAFCISFLLVLLQNLFGAVWPDR
jgi:hypothetical protein